VAGAARLKTASGLKCGLGKAYQQAAAFIQDSECQNPLDNSAVRLRRIPW